MITPRKTCNFFFNNTVHLFHQLDKLGKLFPVSARMPDINFGFSESDRSTSSNGVLAIPARVIATSFAIFCFICTIVYGLYNGNSPQSIFWSAVSVALVALIMGSAIGALMLRSINEQIERHRADNPIPEEHNLADNDTETDAGTQAAVG